MFPIVSCEVPSSNTYIPHKRSAQCCRRGINRNGQYYSLFLGSHSLPYVDRTLASHLAEYSKTYVGWGTHFIDYDNYGSLDLVVANGHVNQVIETTRADVKYKEPPVLLRNNGNAVFQNMRDNAGTVFKSNYSARGLAIGDFDNDGDLDVVFTSLNGRPVLLRNNVGQNNHWIGFEVQGTKSNRDSIGAKITVLSTNHKLTRWITGGGSYLSSQDKRVIVGLANAQLGL